MKRTFDLLGASALVAWTLFGFVAWKAAGDGLQLTFSSPGPSRELAPDDAEIGLQVAGLAGDLRQLSQTLATNFSLLAQRLEDAERDTSAAELANLRERIARLEQDRLRAPTLAAPRAAEEVAQVEGEALRAIEESAELAEELLAEEVVPAIEEPAPPAPKPKASFLAFDLPSDDFRFDERREWKLLPQLCKVGFDAKSTLHDFTGSTTGAEGRLSVNLLHPESALEGSVSVEAAKLDSDSSGRDEEMHERLGVEEFPRIEYRLGSFTPEHIDEQAETVEGTIVGTMTIRGVEHEFSMPVTAKLRPSRRLSIQGEAPLDLNDYGVPVPNKLGLISMNSRVQVWVSLEASLEPRSEVGQ